MKYKWFAFNLIIFALVACTTNTATPAAPTPVPPTSTAAASPTDTPAPTVMPVATNTPAPTETPVPTSMPAACQLTATADTAIYQRPSTDANLFGTLPAGEMVAPTMRSDSGWLGFDPAVAQAANIGVFRLRWLPPDAAVTVTGACDALPLAPTIGAQTCYFMALSDAAVLDLPDSGGNLVTTIPAGGYAAVTGRSSSDWLQLDLADSSLVLRGSGWLDPALANLNGPCDTLPDASP
ncbi:MAG: hypothetical protein KDE09_05660 [Anaerolineales bacterium]|nr:hypothetical protein [Anaerolineales bacterium]